MILKQYIKPVKLEGHGTTHDAMLEIESYLRNSHAFPTYGTLGRYHSDGRGHAFVYNLEVSKRGKHRKNKTFRAHIYRISEHWLIENGKKLQQDKRSFKIVNR